jgi:outer membrane protein OmpA-like peptidoglycan-associated protein
MPAPENAPVTPTGWARWRRPALIAAGVAAVWTGVLGMWLPGWVKPRIEAAASEALGTPVSMAQIHVQPWTAVVAIDGLSVGPASAPMLRLQQAEVQLSLESIWRLAPVLRHVTLIKPDIYIERQSAQRFNFSPVLDKLMAAPRQPSKDDEPVHFAVFNIAVKDGLVRYSDRVLGQSHRVEQLHIGVPFVSNLPSQVQVDVEPLLSARIDGSPLLVKGRTLPFTEGLKSEVDVKLDAVDVPHWVAAAHPFLPDGPKPDARGGRLDTALTIGFEERKPPAVPRLSIKGRLSVSKLALGLANAPGLGPVEMGWGSLQIDGVDAAPLEHQVTVGKVSLDGLQWRSQLLAAAPASKGHPAAQPSVPWSWQLGQLRVTTGRIDVQPVLSASAGQAARLAAAWPAFGTVSIRADKLSSHAKAAPATWQIELLDEHQGRITAQGQAQVARQEVDAQLDIARLQLQPWLAPLSSSLNLPMLVQQGELAIQAKVHARLQTASALEMAGAQLRSGRVHINGLDARATQRGLKDQVKLADFTLDGMQADIDLATGAGLRSLTMDTLHVGQLDAAITRGPHGEWLGMPVGTDNSAGTSSSNTPRQEARHDNKLPDIVLKALRCEVCKLQLTDQTVSPAARFDVSQADLQVAGASTRLDQAIKIDLQTLAQGKGRVQFKGDVRPQPLSVDGRINVAGLDLKAVQPYIDPFVNITLAQARAQADGQLSLQDAGRAGLQARYKGRVGLSDLRVQDRVNEADFLRWQALTLDGLDVAWADQALDANLGRIALKDFYGRIIINPDGKLNLAGIMRHEAGGEARSLTTPEAASAPKSATPTTPAASAVAIVGKPASAATPTLKPKLRWQQIQLTKGRVDFTDNFIKPNYSARLTQVEGQVSAVSSAKPEPATIKIAGAVDDAAPLLITGQIHPLGPQLFTDIQGSAKGIELTRLTPYASRYAGYAIEKGALSVSVHYKVDGGKLEASNQIFLDQLTFGDKTDSPDAIKLPVLLAVSLLKNNRGEIDIDLPISGSLDDPEFSVGGIIWRVIVNLITKAVTAPFALLSGGSSDELGMVPFEPGSAALTPAAQQRLDTLATKLQDRPALKLEATGQADPAVDIEGLRQAYVKRLMRVAKARSLGLPVSEVEVTPEERPTWLAAAYKAADIKKPRNLIGMAKALSDDEMTALLKAAAPVGSEALSALANRRGDAVKAYLVTKLAPERVLLTASKVSAEGASDDKGPGNRVQFAIR